nr:HAD family hydrolase [uncultured Acetatifactor sp.]
MPKAIVFDLGGTLMEFAGMPLNWNDYYIGGFEKLNELLKLNLSENDIQESANKLKSYNPRTSKREYEIKPEVIFNDIISNWGEKPDTNKVIGLFFESLRLKANIYEYSRELLKKCRNSGFKIACLTDLPNGMPDYIFKPAIENILPYFDLYVSSQICGVRKPNKGGICYIADAFEIREAEILFVGDEEKDFLSSLNAGCDFVYINDFLINEKTLHL